MMHAIQEWLAAVVVVAMLLSVVQVLIPEGPIRKIASFTGGLILMVTLLRPVLGMDLSRLELRLHTYEAAIQDRQQELEENGKTELAKLIEERTAAYISDKANNGEKVSGKQIFSGNLLSSWYRMESAQNWLPSAKKAR